MLVLSRKVNERILISDSIVLTVVRVEGGAVRIGIEAPRGVGIVREELLPRAAEATPSLRRESPAVC
jgi:carbon storage regulator